MQSKGFTQASDGLDLARGSRRPIKEGNFFPSSWRPFLIPYKRPPARGTLTQRHVDKNKAIWNLRSFNRGESKTRHSQVR